MHATINNKEIIKDLVFTAVHHKKECLGLAAVQIGENRNIVLIRNIHTKPHEFKYTIMVNLDIFCFTGGVKKSNERCLSFPDRGATPVRRYKRIKFQYQDVTGLVHRKEAKGLEAFIIQHEFDHTNGILI